MEWKWTLLTVNWRVSDLLRHCHPDDNHEHSTLSFPVAIMMSTTPPKALSLSLMLWEPISSTITIMTIRFNSKRRKVTIIECYATIPHHTIPYPTHLQIMRIKRRRRNSTDNSNQQ
ncbi:unnamed protein product [Heterobilharzia americana]|nr:unnamed protein product [Heterobilharzia americana]